MLKFAAFYADCEHEVLPIESGYRVCLVFNLIHKQSAGESRLAAPDYQKQTKKAGQILRQWVGGARPGAEKLVWLLNHRYTPAGLSVEGLKNRDAAIARVLSRAATDAGCAFNLGIVHLEESGWAEYHGGYYGYSRRGRYWDDDEESEDEDDFSIGEVDDARYFIDSWRDRDDRPREYGEIPLQDGEALPPGALDGEEADEKHFTEATGNAGASFERTYLRAACILWPLDQTDDICLSAGVDAGLGLLEERVSAQVRRKASVGEESADDLRPFIRKLIGHWEAGPTLGLRLKRFLAAINELNDNSVADSLPVEFLEEHYTGAQNPELLRLLVLSSESAARRCARAVMETNAWRHPAACMDLWTSMAGNDASLGFLSGEALEALLESLPARFAKRNQRGGGWSWRGAEEVKGPEMTPGLLIRFLAAIQRSSTSSLLDRTAAVIANDLEYFDPERILLPALEMLAKERIDLPPGLIFYLWRETARYFLKRSEQPPSPPVNWSMPVDFPENSPLLRELAKFVRSPTAREHRFRMRKDLRQGIHQTLDHHKLDITHVTERRGSPHTLVCRKMLKTYQNACKVYQSDLAAMKRLAALPAAKNEPGKEQQNRLLAALDFFENWTPATRPEQAE